MDDKLYGISCFSGVGGLDVALGKDVKTVCYIENNPYCQEILRKNIKDGWLDPAPIWSDIQSFKGRPWNGKVDIVFGGFPCQDISVAGKGEGIKEGNRSGLWFEMYRIIKEVHPRYVFLENVAGIRRRGLREVLECLSEAGYNAEWTMLGAKDVGAPHKRERWFCLATLANAPC
jgi:DNA (cytosine-5)-methyltransferase 1